MACSWEKVVLGRTGLRTCPLGLGSSYGIGADDVEHAFDKGINWFYWGSLRRPSFGTGITRLAAKHRDEMIVVVQSYSRVAALMPFSVEWAIRRLKLDHADVLLLGLWNEPVPERILEAARKLKERGRIRHVIVSCHERSMFKMHVQEPLIDGIMVRYNARHCGAERDVFPHLPARGAAHFPNAGQRPGIIGYTATCWGRLLDSNKVAGRELMPRGSDCYRFALTNPSVDMVLAGPRHRAELDEAMAALDRGPMDAEEIAWMKRVGALAT